MAGAAQFMGPGPTRRQATVGSVPVGGSTSDDRKIPACTAGFLIAAGLVLYALDKAKFKMVVGVS
jgi:hypothetical protein